MVTLLPFFIILVAGILFSVLFARLHLPWVIALIAAGIAIGPSGLDIVEPDKTLLFLGEVGLIFLMFMAGLEIRPSFFREFGKGVVALSILTSAIPGFTGFFVGQALGYGQTTSFLLGIVFISTSIAVTLPSLEAKGLLHTKLGMTIIATTVVDDVLSLILLSVVLQTTNTVTTIPLPLFYVGFVLTLVALRFAIPKIRGFISRFGAAGDAFEKEVRSIVVILLGTVALFEVLGVHPIIAAFFAGMVLAEEIKQPELKEKIHALSYGVFIPVFFVTVGMETDLRVFFENFETVLIAIVVIAASAVTKFIAGWLGGLVDGFSPRERGLIGASVMPQLSTALAVVFAARELALLDEKVTTIVIMLSIVTTFIGPFIISKLTAGDDKTPVGSLLLTV